MKVKKNRHDPRGHLFRSKLEEELYLKELYFIYNDKLNV